MKIRGQVIKVNEDCVTVAVTRKEACVGDCTSCGGCNNHVAETEADCDFNVSVGAVVELESNSGYVILGMVILFLMPVFLPVTGYIMLYNFSVTAGYVLAVTLFALSVSTIVYISKSKKYLKKVRPHVTKILYKK